VLCRWLGCVTACANLCIGVVLLILLRRSRIPPCFRTRCSEFRVSQSVNLLVVDAARAASTGCSTQPASLHAAPAAVLYVVPILVAGAIGLTHLDEIPTYLSKTLVEENPLSVAATFREHMVKPLLMVIFRTFGRCAVVEVQESRKGSSSPR